MQDLSAVSVDLENFAAVKVSPVKICLLGRPRLFSVSLAEMQTLMRHVGVCNTHRAKHVHSLGFLLFLLLTYRINVFTCSKPVIVDSVLMSCIATYNSFFLVLLFFFFWGQGHWEGRGGWALRPLYALPSSYHSSEVNFKHN